MDIRERYKIEETSDSLVIYPHHPAVKLAWQVIICIIPAAITLFFFRDLMAKELWVALYAVMAYGVVYSLYEIFIRAGTSYTFHKSANAVIRTTLFNKAVKIMSLEEAVIFTMSERGSWHYAIGAKKTQFIKNYEISENFSAGKKSIKRQEIYENTILDKINQLKSGVSPKNQFSSPNRQ